MKKLAYGCLLAAFGLGFVGCSDDNPWVGGEGEGTLRLSISASADVVDAIPATRAGDALTAPDPAEFRIRLDKNDGSYSKEWASLEMFGKEKGFKTGSYVVTATYGDISEEGFEKPCFSGSAPVTVLEAHETEVGLTATLANSMVSVSYTDAFKNYFTAYAASVHSEGHSYVEYAGSETRPAFVAPGDISLSVSVTDQKGRTVQVQPANFVAEARHHYHVTLDVNGGQVGDAKLVVSFDDTLVKEDIFIDLTDELFTSPAPVVTLSDGYTPGETIEVLQYDVADKPLQFSVMARGGMESAVLTVNSADWTPSFGNEIDLVNASASQQAQLAEAGVKAVGFYSNPDKMGLLDLSAFVAAFPAGRHTISLVAKDKFTRVSDPVSITFDTNAVAINVSASPSVFGSYQIDLTVDYNGRNFEEAFSFKAEDNYGGFADCTIISVQQRARSRAFETRTYDVKLQRPVTERDVVKVKVFYYGNEVAEVEVPLVVPSYSVAADAFSDKVVLKVTCAESDSELIVKSLNIFLDGQLVPENQITRDNSKKLIYVDGLTPSTSYALATTLTTTLGEPVTITTEAQTQLPNGNLSQTTQTINISDVQVGGPYYGWPVTYQNTSSIIRSEANGWASLNQYTCWTGSSNKNTWFLVPSTFVEGGVATIRSVGFSHNGTTPERTGGAAGSTNYCTNSATFNDSEKCAGEMFLGTYSYNGSASRKDGLSFSSRPSSLSFQYEYESLNNEKGRASVEVLDIAGNVIGKGSLDLAASSAMKSVTVNISSYSFGAKAATLKVSFKSSTANVPAISIPTGSALNEGFSVVGNHKIGANAYHAFAKGSELRVKNIKLNY